MAALVLEYRRHPNVRALAIEITRPLRARDHYGEIAAVRRFVMQIIKYVRDTANVETLQTPIRTLQWRAGDCDDQSILVATLLQSIGHASVRFLAMGFAANGGAFSHVVTQARIGSRWVAIETTVPDTRLGWEPPGQTARMTERIE